MKRLVLLVSLVLVFVMAVPAAAGPFSDVPESHWAYDAIQKVAESGIIGGYPDGTFKGKKTVSRYEMAVVITRILNQVAEERVELAEKVDALEGGLTAGQAEDTIAIFKSLIRKHENNTPHGAVATSNGLTEKEAEEVAGIVEALVMEFKFELEDLGADISVLGDRVTDLEGRMDTLEENQDNVTFSGSYSVDFRGVDVEGDKIDADEGSFYYVDPFDAKSGWYESGYDAATNNEFDGTPDYRVTNEEIPWTAAREDYYVNEEPTLDNYVGLNATINKGALEANLNMTGMTNEFGMAGDSTSFNLSSLSGTVTTPEFTATIKDDQEVNFKDYLFNDMDDVSGVVVEAGENTYFIGKNVEEVKHYTDVVAGGEDEYTSEDRDHLLVGANSKVDLVIPFDVLVGYEYAKEGTFDGEDLGEIKNALVALENTSNLLGFDVTTEYGMNLVSDAADQGHLLRVAAEGNLGMIDLVANFENTAKMEFIEKYAYAKEYKKGYDVEASTSLNIFDVTASRESYDKNDNDTVEYNVENAIKIAIPEDELNVAGFAIDGNFEMYRGADLDEGAKKDVRNLNVSKELGLLALGYNYAYDTDNYAYDAEYDQTDDGNNEVSNSVDFIYGSGVIAEDDYDSNSHVITADLNLTDAIDTGVEVKMAKYNVDDSGEEMKWEEDFDRTITLTGGYTSDIIDAGFKKELEGDLVIDGKVTAPTMTVLATSVDTEASYKRNIDTKGQNYMASVEASRALNDKLNLNASYVYDVREIEDWADSTIEGTKQAAKAGLEYTIIEDMKATADFEHMNFVELDTDKEYTVDKATAGVSYEF